MSRIITPRGKTQFRVVIDVDDKGQAVVKVDRAVRPINPILLARTLSSVLTSVLNGLEVIKQTNEETTTTEEPSSSGVPS